MEAINWVFWFKAAAQHYANQPVPAPKQWDGLLPSCGIEVPDWQNITFQTNGGGVRNEH
jgi:hypothetical protein